MGTDHLVNCLLPGSLSETINTGGGRYRGESTVWDDARAPSGLPRAESWCQPRIQHSLFTEDTPEASHTFFPPENLGLTLNNEE